MDAAPQNLFSFKKMFNKVKDNIVPVAGTVWKVADGNSYDKFGKHVLSGADKGLNMFEQQQQQQQMQQMLLIWGGIFAWNKQCNLYDSC